MEYDYISLSVKSADADDIKKCYQALGWEIFDEQRDNHSHGYADLALRRNHYIADKDKLQLLQVKIEHQINLLGRLNAFKNIYSVLLGISLAILGLFMLNSGISLLSTADMVAFPITLILFGVGVLAIDIVLIKRISTVEKQFFTLNRTEITDKIMQMISEAVNIIEKQQNIS